MKNLLLLLLLAGCTKVNIDTEKHSFGALPMDAKELSKVPVLISEGFRGKRPKPPKDTIPTDTTVIPPTPVLPSFVNIPMPAVQNQGGEGSCVGFAICYASYAHTGVVLSPEFLFDRINRSVACSGSGLLYGMWFMRDTGCVTWNTLPYTDGGCKIDLTSALLSEAANYKALSYSIISASDTTALKTLLAAKRPLVIQVGVDNQFYNAGQGFVWKSFTGVVGYHAICICGYDDSKHAFKIINQWGTNWGDSGFSWIDYNFLKSVSSDPMVFNY